MICIVILRDERREGAIDRYKHQNWNVIAGAGARWDGGQLETCSTLDAHFQKVASVQARTRTGKREGGASERALGQEEDRVAGVLRYVGLEEGLGDLPLQLRQRRRALLDVVARVPTL